MSPDRAGPPARHRLEALGRLIRDTRTGRHSVQELAERAGVSAGLISQIERGQGNPSFLTLYKLANALDLRVGDLLEGDDRQPSSGMVVRKDERKRLQLGEEGLVYELLTPDLQRRLEVLRTRVPGDFTNEAKPFEHPGEECVHLLEGRLEVSVEGEFHVLEAGDSITYDSGWPHWWRNPTDQPALIIGAVTPPSF